MERFVLVTAITLALLYAAWHFWGAPSLTFASDDEGFHGAEAVLPGQAGHSAQTYVANSIEIVHAAAHVQVIPEDRTDISLEITNPSRAPMPAVTLANGVVRVDGHFRGRIQGCDDSGARVRGYGVLTPADLTQIVVHTPRTLTVKLGGAVSSTIGATRGLHADMSGCGDSQIADVAGPLNLEVAGSGDVHAGAVQGLDVDLAGAGHVFMGNVTDHAKISAAGAGQLTLAALTGSLESEDAGSGSLTIQGGAITTAHIELAGSGNARIAAPIQNLHAEIVGVGNVDVTNTVGDLYGEIAGPGSVHVQAATGSIRRDIMGPGQVVVGR